MRLIDERKNSNVKSNVLVCFKRCYISTWKIKKKQTKKKNIACTDFENVNAALNLHLYEGN